MTSGNGTGRDNTCPVLIVGWQQSAVAALERNGAEVTCLLRPVDTEHAARAGFTGRQILVPDPTSVEDDLAGLSRAGLRPSDFAVICSEDEFTLVPAGVLATLGGAAGIDAETAVALRDKFVQKDLIRHAGISVAECRVVDKAEDAAGLTPFPLVIKPLAGAGARDTFLLRSVEDLSRVSRTSGPWLVEQFIDGPEVHLNGVVRHGAIVAMGIGRYLEPLIGVHDGGIVATVNLDPVTDADLYFTATRVATGALDALGHQDGIFHMEAFVREGALVFSECAGRMPGGMIVDATERQFQIDLYDEWARALLSKPAAVRTSPASDRGHYGSLHFAAPPGRMNYAPTKEEILEHPGVVQVELKFRAGDEVPDVSAATYLRAGRVLLCGADPDEVTKQIYELDAWFRSAVNVSDE